MSELKGQLLGMLLVIGIFGAIGSVLYGSFKSAASSVASQVSTPWLETSESVVAPSAVI